MIILILYLESNDTQYRNVNKNNAFMSHVVRSPKHDWVVNKYTRVL